MSKQAQNQLKPNHQTCTLKHGPLKEHKSNKEYLLWWEAPCWVAQTDRRTGGKKVYMQSVKSLQVPAFSLWKRISGQTNQLARSWNTVQSVCPRSLLASLKITPSPSPFQSDSFWPHNGRKPHETQSSLSALLAVGMGRGRRASVLLRGSLASSQSRLSFSTAALQRLFRNQSQTPNKQQHTCTNTYWRGATTTRVLRGQSYSSSNLFLNSRSCC